MNESIVVWRVEKKGTGPFQNYDGLSFDIKERFNTPGHRVHIGCTVPNYLFDHRYKFGFESYKDLRFYFGDKLLKRMKKAGYKVAKYRVLKHNVVHGHREIVFFPDDNYPKYELVADKVIVDESTFSKETLAKYKSLTDNFPKGVNTYVGVDWGAS
jgi:hypothetical protein